MCFCSEADILFELKIKFEYLKKIISTYDFKFGTVKMQYIKMHFFDPLILIVVWANSIYVFLAFYAWSTKVGWVLQGVELAENEVRSWILFMPSKVNTKESMENDSFPFLCFDFWETVKYFHYRNYKVTALTVSKVEYLNWQLGHVNFGSGRENPQLTKCCVHAELAH